MSENFAPQLAYTFKVVRKVEVFGEKRYLLEVSNGADKLVAIEQADYARVCEALETVFQYGCRAGGKLYRMYKKERLTNRTILNFVARTLAFELTGTFRVWVEIYDTFVIQRGVITFAKGNRAWNTEWLEHGVKVDLDLKIIDEVI